MSVYRSNAVKLKQSIERSNDMRLFPCSCVRCSTCPLLYLSCRNRRMIYVWVCKFLEWKGPMWLWFFLCHVWPQILIGRRLDD
jgi:hypothetical protein